MSTARSSEPATSRRISAARPAGAAPGPRSDCTSRSRAWSAAASGTIRVIRVAVSAEWRAKGRSRRSIRSGSTQAEWTAKRAEDDRDAQRQDRALDQRLGADVDAAEDRQLAAAQQDRVAALGDDRVDDHDEQPERDPPPGRRRQRVARPGEESGDGRRRAGAGEHDRVRVDERDEGDRPEVGGRRERPGVRERAGPRRVGDRRPHPPSGAGTRSAVAAVGRHGVALGEIVGVEEARGGVDARGVRAGDHPRHRTGAVAHARDQPRPARRASGPWPRSGRAPAGSSRRPRARTGRRPRSWRARRSSSAARPSERASPRCRPARACRRRRPCRASTRASTPASASEPETRSQTSAAARQPTVTASRSDSSVEACRKGSGHDPTTTGVEIAAVQSR